jgi:hypothetical protein
MKRLVALLLLTLLALVAAAPSALAAKPTHERVAVDDVVVDELCGFPVKVHTTGVVLAIEWVDEDGSLRRFEAYPQFRSTYTNLDTGKSIKVNIAGPAHITEGADGSFTLVGTGNWGWDTFPGTDEPGHFLTSGRFVFSIDAAGNESFSRVGRIVDLCAKLAA